MERKLVTTSDGSHTIVIPALNATYHSIHGAIQESMHVFIEAGLSYIRKASLFQQVNIFEMGFGTGLNALLTACEAEQQNVRIHYTAVEQFPLSAEEAKQLNYADLIQHQLLFCRIHQCNWNENVALSEYFTLRKENVSLMDYSTSQQFNLIYYHAFAPPIQPELWTKEIFRKLYLILTHNDLLVTYSSKGDVRRAMQDAGFTVIKLPGPPGKKEILKATKD